MRWVELVAESIRPVLPSRRAILSAAGYLFVDDVEVVRMVAAICPIAALYQFPDGILGCIGGVLRGMGRQTYLMAFNLIGMRLCCCLYQFQACGRVWRWQH